MYIFILKGKKEQEVGEEVEGRGKTQNRGKMNHQGGTRYFLPFFNKTSLAQSDIEHVAVWNCDFYMQFDYLGRGAEEEEGERFR